MRTVTRALVPGCMALFLILWASPLNAKVLNMSGTWKVNMEKSDFGKEAKPKDLMAKTVHKEPALKLSITGTDADGKPFDYEWDGAIDGKPYKGDDGGTSSLKWINDYTMEGADISADGKTTKNWRDVYAKDGKSSIMSVTVKGPEGEYKQRIVWEKQ